VIHADEAILRLKNAESWLKAVEEPKVVVEIDSKNFIYARKLLQYDDFLGGGPCCGAIQESSSWSEY
jgi:Uma2 family endonuclease